MSGKVLEFRNVVFLFYLPFSSYMWVKIPYMDPMFFIIYKYSYVKVVETSGSPWNIYSICLGRFCRKTCGDTKPWRAASRWRFWGCPIGAWLAGIFCLRLSMFGSPEKFFGDGFIYRKAPGVRVPNLLDLEAHMFWSKRGMFLTSVRVANLHCWIFQASFW